MNTLKYKNKEDCKKKIEQILKDSSQIYSGVQVNNIVDIAWEAGAEYQKKKTV